MSDEVLVKVEGVSKKFCYSLKRSLWYGVQDVASEVLGRDGHHDELRKNEFWAVKDISFELRRGECLGLIGPNGAGKSSLLKMLNGLVKPDRGRITMRGLVGALIELGAGFNPILTGRENIYVNGSVLGFSKKEIERKFDAIVDFAGVGEFLDSPVQNYSSGMKMRLGFAVASQMDPAVLLIDEVLAVGDVAFRMACFNRLLELREAGTSMIIVSHSEYELSRIAERCVVMDHGMAIFDGAISAAIATNHQLLLHSNEALPKAEDSRVEIQSVKFLDNEGIPKINFLTGDTVCAEITLASSISVENARLIVAIQSPVAGILGSLSTPFKQFQFCVTPPETKIRLLLQDIPLLVGSYGLNVSLYGPEITDFLDRKAPAASFLVVGPTTNEFGYGITGHLQFEHEWRSTE